MNTTDYVYGFLNLKLRKLIFSTLAFIFLSAKRIKINIYKSSNHSVPASFLYRHFEYSGVFFGNFQWNVEKIFNFMPR